MKSYKFKINGNQYNVEVNSVSGNIADVTVNGTPYQVEMEDAPAVPAAPVQAVQPAATVSAPAAPAPAAPAAPAENFRVTVNGKAYEVSIAAAE